MLQNSLLSLSCGHKIAWKKSVCFDGESEIVSIKDLKVLV